MDFFVGKADVARSHCFRLGSSAFPVGANLASLLRRVIFIREAALGAKLLKIQPFAILPRSFDFLISFQAAPLLGPAIIHQRWNLRNRTIYLSAAGLFPSKFRRLEIL